MVKKNRAALAGLGFIATAALLLSACSSADEPNEEPTASAEDGVPFGSPMEVWHEAFEDVEPITLIVQTPGPQGAPVGAKEEAYYAAVEEWSNGKITFDIAYANAIAGPLDAPQAIAEGRLDISIVLPTFEVERFPTYVAVATGTVIPESSAVVGVLQQHAWMWDVGWHNQDVIDEFADAGLAIIEPFNLSSENYPLICTEKRTEVAELAGAQIVASSAVLASQLSALGASPVFISPYELFEALQRGTVACTATAPSNAISQGVFDVAPYINTFTSSFASTPGALAINKDLYDSLPLVVRQLLFDRTDVFLKQQFESTWEAGLDSAVAAAESGGGVFPVNRELNGRLADFNETVLGDLRAAHGDAFVQTMIDANERWYDVIVDDLGYDPDVTLDTLADYLPTMPDLEGYMEAVFQSILDVRPSE